ETAPSGSVLRRVAHGDVDLGIAGEARTAHTLHRAAILVDQIVAIAAPDPLARRSVLADEIVGSAAPERLRLDAGCADPDASDGNIVLVGPPDSSTRAVTDRYLAPRGDHPPPAAAGRGA